MIGYGNCLFRAFSWYFNGSQDEHMNIRRLLVEFIRNLPEDGDRNWMQFMTPNREQYLEAMKNLELMGTTQFSMLLLSSLELISLCSMTTLSLFHIVFQEPQSLGVWFCTLIMVGTLMFATSILKRRLLISDAFSPPGLQIGMHAYT
jgi:hypothetical protein